MPLLMPRLTKPGMFITATDTGVGKTVSTCAIAATLRRQIPGLRVGVCKPMASGCRRDREGLVSTDAEALAHFSDCRQPLDVINPVRYAAPLAPAVAAEQSGRAVDFTAIGHSLKLLDQSSDVLLIEGIGGVMVPVDHRDARVAVRDLIAALRLPVLLVVRAGLGTLNHTMLSVMVLREARCEIAGLVVNGYIADSSPEPTVDPAMASNRAWLTKMTGLPVLATIPACRAEEVDPERGVLPAAIIDAVGMTYWPDVLGRSGSI